MINKTIIAAGNDAVSDIPLHYYILAQTENKRPSICLLPTASGDAHSEIKRFFDIFSRYNCKPDFLPLFHNKEKNIREFILKQDAIIVSGGHSFSMMAVWKAWGLDKILLEAYEKGIVLSGGSAGSVCWYSEALSDSVPHSDGFAKLKCLNFLPYSHCPHYRSHDRRVAYKSAILKREIIPGYAINDGCAIHYQNGKFLRAVSSEHSASAFYVDIDSSGKEEKIKSERLETHFLGDKAVQEKLIWGNPAFEYLNEPTVAAPSLD